MTRKLLRRVLAGWLVLLAVACIVVHSWFRLDSALELTGEDRTFVRSAFQVEAGGNTFPEEMSSRLARIAENTTIASVWREGRIIEQTAYNTLMEAVRGTAEQYPDTHRADHRLEFTFATITEEGPLSFPIMWIQQLSVVPWHEGLIVELEGEMRYLTPHQLISEERMGTGVSTPIPDFKFGIDIQKAIDWAARDLGVDTDVIAERGSVRRFRAVTFANAYPEAVEVNLDTLREATLAGAAFLMRHQYPDGHFTYVYNAPTDRDRQDAYSMPRHSGTTYFMAQAANQYDNEEIRAATRQALMYVIRVRTRKCGGPEFWCIDSGGYIDMGSTALTALAAAEYLMGADDPEIQELLEGTTAFIRSLQREDGEFMHEWDLENDEPIDVQHMYYSGEAAFALLRAHAVDGREADLSSAQKAMRHLTGSGWDFFGSRYYYGEEHWTCIAAGEASDRVPSAPARDFCQRWLSYGRQLQYGEGETQWLSTGGYGVGPLFPAMLTPVGSRTEAAIGTYVALERAGEEDPELRGQIERGLSLLMAHMWTPGPTHMFADPARAHGGLPAHSMDLTSRNDYVQHAGSAFVRWAQVLEAEAAE